MHGRWSTKKGWKQNNKVWRGFGGVGREWGGSCIELGVELWSHLSKFSLVHKPLLCTKYLGDTVALYLVPFYSYGWALNPSPTPPCPFVFPLFVSFSNLLFPLGFEPSPSLPSLLRSPPPTQCCQPSSYMITFLSFMSNITSMEEVVERSLHSRAKWDGT